MKGTGGYPFQGFEDLAEKSFAEGAEGPPSQGMAIQLNSTDVKVVRQHPFLSAGMEEHPSQGLPELSTGPFVDVAGLHSSQGLTELAAGLFVQMDWLHHLRT